MKKIIAPILICGITLFGGCRWFRGKTENASPIEKLEAKLAEITEKVSAIINERNQNPEITALYEEIQEKAKVANNKIKTLIQQKPQLKTLNDAIMEKRKQLNDKDLDLKKKQEIAESAKKMVSQFKKDTQYKEEIEPLEKNIKEISQKYNLVAAEYNKTIQHLMIEKEAVSKQLSDEKGKVQTA